ncbi:hypothetical protein ONZ45_g11343 [Pleurotus djamor]|nr:hypothetical protein ONZ45_g11343 [Pleurotus djamor]
MDGDDNSPPPPPPEDQQPPAPPNHTGSPTDFLKGVVGKRVIVRLTSGVDYRGILSCLDGYMNIALEQTEEHVNGAVTNRYGDAFIRGNNGPDSLEKPQCEVLSRKASLRTIGSNGHLKLAQLPQLCIPPQCSQVPGLSPNPGSRTPDSPSPASLNSAERRIVDLTQCMRTISKEPDAHGGFSDIYQGEWERAVDPEDDSKGKAYAKVAVKLLRVLSSRDQDATKARKRLNREVFVWHRLDHPHIAKFYGTSYHMGNRPAMVMQWYSNGSASGYLKYTNPSANRLHLVRDVARGLAYLHTLKPPIVHGDLKGNNILITDDGHAAISDFGLSQVIDDLLGPTGFTPSYSEAGPVRWQAPELLQDDHSRPKLPSDVWSFACTAYELLTGLYPYQHRARDYLVIQDIINGVKPFRSEDVLDPAVTKILNQCWAPNPAERPSMVDVCDTLERLCSSN